MPSRMRDLAARAVAVVALLLWANTAPAANGVDLRLVLAVDVSASMTPANIDMQFKSHAAALRDGEVQQALLRSGPARRALLTFVQWSDPGSMKPVVPWTELSSAAEIEAFARRIDEAPRPAPQGSTAVGAAIDSAWIMLRTNKTPAHRSVIDLSSNGFNNTGLQAEHARDKAVEDGVVINALVILDEFNWLEKYYEDNVAGGPGSFVLAVENPATFTRALISKLVAEIAGVPPALPPG